MKNFRSYRTLLATSVVASSQVLAMMSASANPLPTPLTPTPIVPTRVILNGSFEQPVVTSFVNGASVNGTAVTSMAGGNIPEAYNSPSGIPVIWSTTETGNSTGQYDYKNAIEVWRGTPGSGGQPNTSGAGVQYAELNGSDNAALFQDICVLPTENVSWSLLHAARTSATTNPTNIMQVSVTDIGAWTSKTPPAVKLYNSPNLSVTFNDGWKAQSGSWTSSNTTIQPLRFAFAAIQGSQSNTSTTNPTYNNTYGNFLDDIKLNLSALIDFLPPDGTAGVNIASTTEGNPSTTNPPYYYLSLRLNGVMTSAASVKISLTGLNAGRSYTLGSVFKGNNPSVSGLNASKNGNVITLNIPAGTYDANSPSNYIHIPIDFSDNVRLPNDTLTFTLSNPSGGGGSGIAALQVNSSSCGTPRTTVTTLLIEDDFQQNL